MGAISIERERGANLIHSNSVSGQHLFVRNDDADILDKY